MATWQQTLVPPPVPLQVSSETRELGRRVFERANCSGCHSGPFLTNNRVVPSAEVGANPVRSVALQKTELNSLRRSPMASTLRFPYHRRSSASRSHE